MGKYLSYFETEEDFYKNQSELNYPNVTIVKSLNETVSKGLKYTKTKLSTPQIDIKSVKTKGKNSKFSVGDLFIYDKGLNKFYVGDYESIIRDCNNGILSGTSNIIGFGVCVIPDRFLNEKDNMMTSFARFITLGNLDNGAMYLWDDCVSSAEGYIAKNGLISNYSTAYAYPILNDKYKIDVNDVPVRYETVGNFPFDDGIFKNAKYVNSTSMSTECVTDPGTHWDWSAMTEKENKEINELLPVTVDFAPSPYKLSSDGTYYELDPNYSITTDYSGALFNGKEELTNGIVPNALLDVMGMTNTYKLHTLNMQNDNADFDAAEKVYNYNSMYTVSSEDHKGWFYIPAAGELAFIIARINTINKALSRFSGSSVLFSYNEVLGEARDPETGEIKPQTEYLPTWYWGSTQANRSMAVVMNTFSVHKPSEDTDNKLIGGKLGGAFKFDTCIRTRPFFMLKPNYNEGDSICIIRMNDNYPDGQLVKLNTVGDN